MRVTTNAQSAKELKAELITRLEREVARYTEYFRILERDYGNGRSGSKTLMVQHMQKLRFYQDELEFMQNLIIEEKF